MPESISWASWLWLASAPRRHTKPSRCSRARRPSVRLTTGRPVGTCALSRRWPVAGSLTSSEALAAPGITSMRRATTVCKSSSRWAAAPNCSGSSQRSARRRPSSPVVATGTAAEPDAVTDSAIRMSISARLACGCASPPGLRPDISSISARLACGCASPPGLRPDIFSISARLACGCASPTMIETRMVVSPMRRVTPSCKTRRPRPLMSSPPTWVPRRLPTSSTQ
jgi:hypothetical protein